MTPDASDETSLVGRVIQDRFRIIERLAAGGMGAVYLAEQLPLGRKVALKVLEPAADNMSSKAQFQERFLLEAAAVAKLSHANTIVLYDYGRTEDGRYFYAMELVEGMTLTKLIRERRFVEPALAVHIAAQICGSLREAHEVGLVHRDLKPSNVMLTRRGDDPHYVKVLDFGLVKMVGTDSASDLTRSGIVLGSPRYMAPEQIETRAVDHRADIYAFGALLYNMLAGEPPFVYPSQFETLRAQVDEAPPPLEAKNPWCEAGPELRSLTFQCLEKRPEARPQSMAEIITRLKSCAMEIGISIPSISGVDISLLASRSAARPQLAPIVERVSSPPTVAARPSALAAPSQVAEAPAPPAAAAAPARSPLRWLVPAAIIGAVGIAAGAIAFLVPVGASDRDDEVAQLAPPPVHATPPAPDPTPPVAPTIAAVSLVSDPPGARVHHGTEDLGDAPVALPIPPGERWELTLSLAGHEPRTITVVAGQPSAHVTLTPVAAEPVVAAPPPEPAQRSRSRTRSHEEPAVTAPEPQPLVPVPTPPPVNAWRSHSDNRDPWGQ